MKLLSLIMTMLVSAPLFAKPAMSFSCNGVRKPTNSLAEQVMFTVDYADWDNNAGYTSQTILFSMPDEKEIDLEEVREHANRNPECIHFEELSLRQSPNPDFHYFAFILKVECAGEANFKIEAYCDRTL